jgi:hypothetical protein
VGGSSAVDVRGARGYSERAIASITAEGSYSSGRNVVGKYLKGARGVIPLGIRASGVITHDYIASVCAVDNYFKDYRPCSLNPLEGGGGDVELGIARCGA